MREGAPCPPLPDALLHQEGPALVAAAQALKRAAPALVLRGRYVAVLNETGSEQPGDAFCGAARALGAAVVHIRRASLLLATPRAQRHTAHALGQLYAALACDSLEPALLGALQRWSGVPVFGAVAAPAHPSWALAAQLVAQEQARRPAPAVAPDAPGPLHEHHRYIVQAMLLHCVMSA